MQRMVDLAEGRRVRDLDTLRSWLGRSWESEDDVGSVRQRDAQTLGVSEGAVKFYRSSTARPGPDRDDTRERLPSAEAEESGHRTDLAAGLPPPPDEEETSTSLRDRPVGYMSAPLVMGSIRHLEAPAPEKAKRKPFFSTWHRHQVHPDVEINFRRKEDPLYEKRLGELIAVASRLFAGFRDREEEANNDPQIEGKEKDHDEE